MSAVTRQNFEDIEIGQEFIFDYEIQWQELPDRGKHRVLPYIIPFVKIGQNSYKSLKISELFADNRGGDQQNWIQVNQKGVCYGRTKVVVVG